MNDQNRVLNQSVNEWLEEYETGKLNQSKQVISILDTCPLAVHYRYVEHRTAKNKGTGKGFLVLCFEHVETREEAFAFYNVDTTIQRGPKRGQEYAIGRRGQFLAPQRGAFRKLWYGTVGQPPRRWAAAYKEMYSKFGPLIFSAKTATAYWQDGTPYTKLLDIHKRNNSRTS